MVNGLVTGLHEYSHVPVPFYRSIQYSRVVKSNSFALLFPVL